MCHTQPTCRCSPLMYKQHLHREPLFAKHSVHTTLLVDHMSCMGTCACCTECRRQPQVVGCITPVLGIPKTLLLPLGAVNHQPHAGIGMRCVRRESCKAVLQACTIACATHTSGSPWRQPGKSKSGHTTPGRTCASHSRSSFCVATSTPRYATQRKKTSRPHSRLLVSRCTREGCGQLDVQHTESGTLLSLSNSWCLVADIAG